MLREIRSDASDTADGHGIDVFSENLKNLLLPPPIKGTRVLGVDPGIRTGTKCAALDETGKFLDYFVINQEVRPEEGKKAMAEAVRKHFLGARRRRQRHRQPRGAEARGGRHRGELPGR